MRVSTLLLLAVALVAMMGVSVTHASKKKNLQCSAHVVAVIDGSGSVKNSNLVAPLKKASMITVTTALLRGAVVSTTIFSQKSFTFGPFEAETKKEAFAAGTTLSGRLDKWFAPTSKTPSYTDIGKAFEQVHATMEADKAVKSGDRDFLVYVITDGKPNHQNPAEKTKFDIIDYTEAELEAGFYGKLKKMGAKFEFVLVGNAAKRPENFPLVEYFKKGGNSVISVDLLKKDMEGQLTRALSDLGCQDGDAQINVYFENAKHKVFDYAEDEGNFESTYDKEWSKHYAAACAKDSKKPLQITIAAFASAAGKSSSKVNNHKLSEKRALAGLCYWKEFAQARCPSWEVRYGYFGHEFAEAAENASVEDQKADRRVSFFPGRLSTTIATKFKPTGAVIKPATKIDCSSYRNSPSTILADGKKSASEAAKSAVDGKSLSPM